MTRGNYRQKRKKVLLSMRKFKLHMQTSFLNPRSKYNVHNWWMVLLYFHKIYVDWWFEHLSQITNNEMDMYHIIDIDKLVLWCSSSMSETKKDKLCVEVRLMDDKRLHTLCPQYITQGQVQTHFCWHVSSKEIRNVVVQEIISDRILHKTLLVQKAIWVSQPFLSRAPSMVLVHVALHLWPFFLVTTLIV